ncbi:DUF6344 domain-containing protein [Streptomyces sp. A5-4]|uniref:DUF6344 domain-containing protein n=1 Tax=Streptomyces sp. A5-4 TaxID=3384771 RepID=UPI003DA9C635
MKARTMWTALITALFALLATLGLSTAATAAQQPATASAPTGSHPAAEAASAAVTWSPAHEQSVPPTMKQRIRAEAHGASPSSRHLPRELGDVQRPDLGQIAAATTPTA